MPNCPYSRITPIIATLILTCTLLGCNSIQKCGTNLQAYRDLPGLWNSIKRMRERPLLHRWINRFLASLLHNGRYQLEDRGHTFVVIDPKDAHENRCRMPTSTQQKMLKDPTFLQYLHNKVTQYRIDIRKYRYRPPKTIVVQGNSKVWGGNCNLRKFRVEASYWKAISNRYSQARWKEACRVGKQLKRWRECFNTGFTAMYNKRMGMICK